MRYVAVARVSTDNQGHNLSEAVQFETIHAYASGQLWDCAGQFFDVASGSEKGLDDREGLRKALELIEHGDANYFIMYDTSRIGREGKVVDDLVKRIYALGGKLGVATERRLFHSAVEAEELLFWTKNVSHFEYLQIRKRTSRGKRMAFEMGSFIWKPLFGYSVEKRGTQKVLVVNPQQAAIVEDVFRKLVAGTTKSEAAFWCRSKGFHVGLQRVEQFVRDVETYAGGSRTMTITFDNERFERPVVFPRVIDDKLANDVRRTVRVAYRAGKEPTPFLGVLKCLCGGSGSSYVSTKNKSGVRRVQLCCSTVIRGRARRHAGRDPGEFCRHSVSARYVSECVLEFLSGGSESFTSMRDALGMVVESHGRELTAVEDASRDLEARRQRVHARVAAVNDDSLRDLAEVFNAELKELKAEEARLAAYETRLHKWLEEDGRKYGNLTATSWDTLGDAVRKAIQADDWKIANNLLSDLGIVVSVNFDSKSPRETLEVQLV